MPIGSGVQFAYNTKLYGGYFGKLMERLPQDYADIVSRYSDIESAGKEPDLRRLRSRPSE